MNRAAFAALLVFACLYAPVATAHPLAPAVLTLRTEHDGAVTLIWRTPTVRPKGNALELRIPERCQATGKRRTTVDEERTAITTKIPLQCDDPDLTGVTVTAGGLEMGTVNVVVRIIRPGQPTQHAILDAHQRSYTVQSRASAGQSILSYVRSGIGHLLEGYDHLAFILGLLVLFGMHRKLLFAVTAFTIGHSITLALAFLDVVRVPQAPVEVLIAATIVYLGLEMLRDEDGLMSRHPWTLPMVLGLLHGMGFASALRGVGVPADEVPTALLGFNVGIELGQLFVIALAMIAFRLLRPLIPGSLRQSRTLPAYVVGSLGAYWMLQRLSQIAQSWM